MAKRKRYSVEQIVRKFREAEVEISRGQTVGQVCRKQDRFDEVVAELNNGAMAVYGAGCYLAQEHAAEMLDDLTPGRRRGIMRERSEIPR